MPTSHGSCGVAATGVESCSWISAINLHETITRKAANLDQDFRKSLFVTTFKLAPGAALDGKQIVGGEVLIVCRNKGEVTNEEKAPAVRIDVDEGLVMLMPKEEPYLLRNTGKDFVELLLIEVRE